AEDIAKMARIVEDGIRAGALGFSTSRTVLHQSVDREPVPGTTARQEELMAIGRAMRDAGHGVFEMVSDLKRSWKEFEWMGRLSRETRLPVTFTATQSAIKDLTIEEQIAEMREQNSRGANIVAQIALRGVGIIMGWQGTMHPFMFKRSWAGIARLPWAEQFARLQDPEFRRRIIDEPSRLPNSDIFRSVTSDWAAQYVMDHAFSYEPGAADSIAARAAAARVPCDEYAYDLLMQDNGCGFIYFPVINYHDGNLDFLENLLTADDTVNSLSDGGAHCSTICDAASPTFMLQHWVRDRPHGRIPLQLAIKRQSSDTARLYGLHDRGLVKPGMLADLNIIDLDNIRLGKPWLAADLPAGGKRLLQRAEGYVATIKSGEVTFRQGVMQSARPGAVVRGPQAAPSTANPL